MPSNPLSNFDKNITSSVSGSSTLPKALSALCLLFIIFVYSLATGHGVLAAEEDQTTTPVLTAPPIITEVLPSPTPERAISTVVVPTATHGEAPTHTPILPSTNTPVYTSTSLPADTPTEVPATAPTEIPTALSTAAPIMNNTPLVTVPTFAVETVKTAQPTATETVAPTKTHTATPTLTATPTRTGTATPSWLPPGPECVSAPGPTVVKLDVPYIHQVIDFGSADGNWACGPTSVAMVLAYYGKLEPWNEYMSGQVSNNPVLSPVNATPQPSATPLTPLSPLKPGKVTDASNFSPYVTNAYTNNGHTYSATAPDPRGNRVAGLYGAICPTGFADWSRMEDVLQWHGLSARQLGASWDAIVGALKRGHPVLIGNGLTAEGHILVAIGYTKDGQLLVNDPYGNRFAPGYGGTSGKGLFYPWKCMRARNALEVIGTYPPPPRPTHTPAPTATATSTGTVTSTGTIPLTMAATAAGITAAQVSATGSVAPYGINIMGAGLRLTPATTSASCNASSTANSVPASSSAGASPQSAQPVIRGGTAPTAPIETVRQAEKDKATQQFALGGSLFSVLAVLIAYFGLRGLRRTRIEVEAAPQPENSLPSEQPEA